MASASLKKLSSSKVSLLKLRNRRGYAAICMNHLTEGKTSAQAYARMEKAINRAGYQLIGNLPTPK